MSISLLIPLILALNPSEEPPLKNLSSSFPALPTTASLEAPLSIISITPKIENAPKFNWSDAVFNSDLFPVVKANFPVARQTFC